MAVAVAVALALLLAAGCGDDDGTGTADGGNDDGGAKVGEALGEALGEGTTTTTAAAPATQPPAVPVADLGITSVGVPNTAPDGVDACQAPTSFDAVNLYDGYADTSWRASGDLTGQELTVSLGGQHEVRSVGLIPGYAKVDSCDGTDRFAQNRRVLRATWTFDDGTSVSQDFAESPEMQSVSVTTATSTIRLRIETVSGPGGKDFTAISEISVRGS